MQLEDLLTEQEQDAISRLADDSLTLTALKKVLLSAIHFDGTIQNKGLPKTNFILDQLSWEIMDDKDLGSKVRAKLSGARMMEEGFKRLLTLKKNKELDKNRSNPAR